MNGYLGVKQLTNLQTLVLLAGSLLEGDLVLSDSNEYKKEKKHYYIVLDWSGKRMLLKRKH